MTAFHVDPDDDRRSVTFEPERRLHLISDEELQMLVKPDDVPMAQVFWAAIGILFGSLQATASALGQVGLKPMTLGDVAAIAITAAAGPLAVLAGISAAKRKAGIATMYDKISARPTRPHKHVPDLDYVPFQRKPEGNDVTAS